MTSGAVRQQWAGAASAPYDGVLSRSLLSELGADRNVVARQVRGMRWRQVGRLTVSTHPGALTPLALRWRAIWEVGGPEVALDGVSAMVAAGLTGFNASETVHVSVPHHARVASVPGVRIHRIHRTGDEILGEPPRVRTALATVRAAQWAVSDRQAALLLVLPVQQRLLTGAHLVHALSVDRVRGRRALLRQLVADIADGAHSLGELDFAAMCRRRGLPPPDRQKVVRSRTGRIYLDVRWSAIGLVIEIDGAGHQQGLALGEDNLRQNLVTLRGNAVLRYDLLTLRLRADEVLDQVCEAHAVLSLRGTT